MNNFNPFLPAPSPYRQQNRSYAGPSQSFYGGGYPAPGYTPAYSPYDGPDAWMEPGYPGQQPRYTQPQGYAAYLPPSQPPCSGPPNPNVRNCSLQHAAKSVGGAAIGGWGGAKAGWKGCPPTPSKPYCVGASMLGGAAFGGVEGYASAIDTASCQDVIQRGRGGTCTNTDPGHMHFSNHVER